jgi:predicted GNAT superfamily acetyltransferase
MAVAKDYQNKGVGARLKWAQRERALRDGRKLIKWTWDPMLARNAHFNLNRLGATVATYLDDFYGVDYGVDERLGLPSDRLSATWEIDSPRVHELAQRTEAPFTGKRVATIAVPTDWNALLKRDVERARAEQTRVREDFHKAFGKKLICAGFERGQEQSRYVLFEAN